MLKKLATAITIASLAACAQLSASGAGDTAGGAWPDWLRDPARGEYPYSPKGW